MLRVRIAVSLLLLPVLIWIIAVGSWLYLILVALALALAAVEYGLLFKRTGLRPALPLLAAGVAALITLRQWADQAQLALALAAVIMMSMIWHALDFERGATASGTDFAITVSGTLYLGWIGGYLVDLRALPFGQWWVLLALPTVWLADSAAYLVGGWIGRHKLSPRLSPNKTWEGYLAGVLIGTLAGAGLALLWRIGAGAESNVDALHGAVLGGVIAAISPFGDLGISMLKRQMAVKDSGSLLSAHGGALDRFDSWLWAGALGYYVVLWLP